MRSADNKNMGHLRIVKILLVFGLFGFALFQLDRVILSSESEQHETSSQVSSQSPNELREPIGHLGYKPGFGPGHRVAGGSVDPLSEQDLIGPGIYATFFGVQDCSYKLHQVIGDKRTLVGQDHLKQGRMLITFNDVEPYLLWSALQCGEWIEWSPPSEALNVADNGDYWSGDLLEGTWRVPAGCYWEKVVGFRGNQVVDVVDSGFGPGYLEVDSNMAGLRLRGCSGPIEQS